MRPRWAAPLVIAIVGFLVSGCLNATISLTVDEQDRVSGEVAVAVPPAPEQQRLRLRPPGGLSDRVRVEPYSQDGTRGSKLVFNDLTFGEVERLAAALSRWDSRYDISLTRSGSLLKLNGSVDLTPLADTDSNVLVEVSTPGAVTTTNGELNAGMVRWRPEAGEVTEMSASFQFNSSQSGGWFAWAALVGGLTLGVALLVGVLALLVHHRANTEAASRLQ